MLVLNEPGRVFFMENARALAALLRIQFPVFNRLKHIIEGRPSRRTGDRDAEISNRAEKIHSAAPIKRGAVVSKPSLDAVASFRFSVLHAAVIGRIELEHGLLVSRLRERR